jgi:glycine cleavage system transcriptional repressor
MANRWIVTALGQDKPGIVAGVTEVLYKLGCNLEDSAMTRLESEFTVMLIFSAPAKITEAKLAQAFAPAAKRLKLAVHVKPLSAKETAAPSKAGAPFVISVYGADKAGIVFQVAQALAKARVNITDVHTHRSASGGPSLYAMLLEVEAPAKTTEGVLTQQLAPLAKKLGVELSVRASDAAVL